jgi:hypothetical protein
MCFVRSLLTSRRIETREGEGRTLSREEHAQRERYIGNDEGSNLRAPPLPKTNRTVGYHRRGDRGCVREIVNAVSERGNPWVRVWNIPVPLPELPPRLTQFASRPDDNGCMRCSPIGRPACGACKGMQHAQSAVTSIAPISCQSSAAI